MAKSAEPAESLPAVAPQPLVSGAVHEKHHKLFEVLDRAGTVLTLAKSCDTSDVLRMVALTLKKRAEEVIIRLVKQ